MSDEREGGAEGAGLDPPDEALLAALGGLARDDDAGLPPMDDLEALAAGAGDRDALAALLGDEPDALAVLDALATPPDAAARAGFADAALAALGGEVGSEGAAPGSTDTAPEAAPARAVERPSSPRDNVVPFQPRRRTALWMGVAVIAAAAAVVVFTLRPQGPALPTYAAEVSGGQMVVRGDGAAEVPTLGPDDRLSVVLTPAVPVEGEVEVTGFVIEADGATRAWSPNATVSPDGAVVIDGTGRALGLVRAGAKPGLVTLRVAVGRAGASPDSAEAALGKGPWQTFDLRVARAE